LAGGVEEGFADAAEVARLDANENRSGVDDRVPMLNHAAIEIGQQPGPNHSICRLQSALKNLRPLFFKNIRSVFFPTKHVGTNRTTNSL